MELMLDFHSGSTLSFEKDPANSIVFTPYSSMSKLKARTTSY